MKSKVKKYEKNDRLLTGCYRFVSYFYISLRFKADKSARESEKIEKKQKEEKKEKLIFYK